MKANDNTFCVCFLANISLFLATNQAMWIADSHKSNYDRESREIFQTPIHKQNLIGRKIWEGHPIYAKMIQKSISSCSAEKVMFTGNQTANKNVNQQTNANDLMS